MSQEKSENKIKAQLKKVQDKIDGLTVRERGILMLAAIAVMYAMFELTVLKPLDTQKNRLKSKLPQIATSIDEINTQITSLHEQQTFDPDEAEKARIATLSESIATVDEELSAKMGGVVSPAQMTEIVRGMLTQNDGLTLKRMETLPTTSLAVSENNDPDAPTMGGMSAGIYKHTVRMELEGSYLDVLAYLQKLEQISSSFFWQGVSLRTESYPSARVTLEIFTLSSQKGWVGV